MITLVIIKIKMMKSLTNLVVLVLLPAIIIAHEEPSKTLYEKKAKEKAALKISNARIHETTAWKYSLVDGRIQEEGSKILEQQYDREGKLVGLESYKNDTLKLIVRYDFDEFGNMLSDIDFSPDDKMIEKNLFLYDSEGRVISGKSYDSDDQMTSYFKIIRSTDKKTIEFIKYTSSDSLDYKITYFYASDYDMSDYIEAKKTGPDNEMQLLVKKKHNDAGLVTEKAVYGAAGSLSYTFYYEYDEAGNTMKITKQLPEGRPDWFDIYLNDLNGNCNEVNSYDSAGNLDSKIKYTFEYFND